jgi:uncharacterized protein YndB with AHSA1/START domain
MIAGQTIVHEVTYPHPPERVWRALVDAEEMASWLMPNDDFVPRVGQHFTLSCDSHGLVNAEVLEIDPPRLLRCRWVGSFGATVVTFELSPTAAGTRVRLEHRGWRPGDSADRDAFDSGWARMLGTDLVRDLGAAPGSDRQPVPGPSAGNP